jgi:hypothetical protein
MRVRKAEVIMNTRPSTYQLGLSTGKKARLHRILHEHGVRNGTAIFLPYDHGLEHGPRDFAGHPDSSDAWADGPALTPAETGPFETLVPGKPPTTAVD